MQAGETHFVAVWNQNQPGSDTVLPIPVGGSLIFIPIGGHVRGAQNVRFEAVERDIGSAAFTGFTVCFASSRGLLWQRRNSMTRPNTSLESRRSASAAQLRR